MDGNIAAVLVALAGAIPATIAAWNSRKAHKEVQTNHGKRAGEYLELISADIIELKTDFAAHKQDDKEFQDKVAKVLPLEEGSQN